MFLGRAVLMEGCTIENENYSKISKLPPFIPNKAAAIAQSTTYLKDMGMEEKAEFIKTYGIPFTKNDENSLNELKTKDLKKTNPGGAVLNVEAKNFIDQKNKGKNHNI